MDCPACSREIKKVTAHTKRTTEIELNEVAGEFRTSSVKLAATRIFCPHCEEDLTEHAQQEDISFSWTMDINE